jgi:hypothetical protein
VRRLQLLGVRTRSNQIKSLASEAVRTPSDSRQAVWHRQAASTCAVRASSNKLWPPRVVVMVADLPTAYRCGLMLRHDAPQPRLLVEPDPPQR